MRRSIALAAALAACGGAAAAPQVGARAQLAGAPAAAVLVVEAPLPAGRVPLRFRLPDAPGWALATIDPTPADCAPYAPPGAATVACPTEARPLRRCRTATAHLACAVAVPAGPAVRLGYVGGGVPAELGPAACWIGGATIPCRWEAS